MGVCRPKVRRIALESAFEPSMMNNRGRVGSTPRSTKLSISAWTTEAFSVAPSISPRGCLIPSPSMPTAATRTRCSVMWMPSICTTKRSSPRKVRLHKALHALARQRHEMPRCRRFRRPGSRWCRNIALRKPYRPTEFPRRDIDEHQIHRPPPEPVLGHCVLPARQHHLLAAEFTNSWPFDIDLAAMEANLPLRVAPTIPASALSARMARSAKLLRILLQHRRKRLDAGRQAEPLEAR